jgi:long-chain acyl-CoA synthetase
MNSVLDIIFKQVQLRSSEPALHYLENTQYVPISYHAMALNAERLGVFVQSVCDPGQHVVIWSNNCWQWAIADLSIQLAGGVSVPVYPTSGMDQLTYIFNDAKPVLIFVDELTSKRLSIISKIEGLKKVVVFGKVDERPGRDLVIDFDDALASVEEVQKLTNELWMKDRLNDPFTTLYTSGTTGTPKAVPLTHNNIVQNFLGILDIIPIENTDASLSFLPLSHIFERTVGFVCVLGVGATIYYAESMDTVARDLLIAKPTFIISVPRLYDKIYAKVMGNAGVKKIILALALGIGANFKRDGFLWKLAYKVVFSKIHQKTGGNVRFLVSGGAPISRHVEKFFNAIGLPVVQGYGLSETSPIITANLDQKVGSVGKPLDNLDVKIADDGEICVKGPSVFSGYSNGSNDDVFTEDGFFRTGDLGYFDHQGYLYVSGRKKEIIVLSNGKNVSPNRVEEQLLQSQYVNQLVVVGDNKHYLSALIVIDVDNVQQALGVSDSLDVLSKQPSVKELIAADLKRLSVHLATFETVKRFALVPNEFSIDGKELTPTLKLRRQEINKKYHDLIESLYDK